MSSLESAKPRLIVNQHISKAVGESPETRLNILVTVRYAGNFGRIFTCREMDVSATHQGSRGPATAWRVTCLKRR